MGRIGTLEALRGVMALWVVIGHAIRHAGYMPADFGPLRPLFEPGHAVDVFIILSGFVIFFLLDRQPGTYRVFIVRRFFRLFPLFVVVLLVSAALHGWKTDALALLPWPSDALASSQRIHAETAEHFWTHLLVHLTMLHGLVSGPILPSSDYAFVGQAWSISVEWQFYLVAPFLFWLVVEGRWRALAATIVLICVVRFTNYGHEGFAVRQAGYFFVGILSFYAYRRLRDARLNALMIDAMVLVAVAVVYMFLARGLSLMIWAAVFGLVIAEHQSNLTVVQRFGLALLNHPLLLWLGKVSYSVYMVHLLAMTAAIYALRALAPAMTQSSFALALVGWSIAGTVALAALTYRFVERPGMAFGKRLARDESYAGAGAGGEMARAPQDSLDMRLKARSSMPVEVPVFSEDRATTTPEAGRTTAP